MSSLPDLDVKERGTVPRSPPPSHRAPDHMFLRGIEVYEFRAIADVPDGLATHGVDGNAWIEARVKQAVERLCGRFPIYE